MMTPNFSDEKEELILVDNTHKMMDLEAAKHGCLRWGEALHCHLQIQLNSFIFLTNSMEGLILVDNSNIPSQLWLLLFSHVAAPALMQ
jgi:hypothetical protein